MATVLDSIVQPDESAIKAHLETLFAPLRDEYPRGLIEIRYGERFRSRYFNIHSDGIADCVAFCAGMSRGGDNVYVGVNPRKASINTGQAAKDTDVECAVWHFADVDEEACLRGLGAKLRPLPPTYSVDTGTAPHRRPHLYWQLEEPIYNMDEWSARQRGIAAALGSDPVVINPSRIMRLAGTINFPPQHKLQKGYRVERVALNTDFEDERPPVSPDMVGQAYPPVQGQLSDYRGQPDIGIPITGQTTLQAMRPTRVHDLLEACRRGDQWHNNMIRLVAHLASLGRTNAEIVALADHITLPGYTVEGTRREMLTALQGARQKWAIPEPEDMAVEAEEAAREEAARPLDVVDAFDFDESDIPVRPWLVPGALLAGYTHMLAAPGGSGKSLFTLQLAIALASGTQWGGFIPRKRYRSVLINVEDDIIEQRRRLAAAVRVMGIDPQSLRGWIFLVDASQGIVVAGRDQTKGSLITTPVTGKLHDFIKEAGIDVLFADPFAETFEGDENDNSEVKWAMKIWRDEIARATGAAVYLVHHTTKYAANGAGDANVIRGAGAIVNSTRISATLMPMTADEATAIGIDQGERHLFVRYDDAKANQSLKTNNAKWFRKESVELSNGRGLQEPDEVGALVPWAPPDAFDGVSVASINTVLDRIEEGVIDSDGVVTGVRFTASTKGGSKESGRWAGSLLMEMLGLQEGQARKMLAVWLRNGVLVEKNYRCPEQRRDRNGLFAPHEKRPGMEG